MGDFAYKKVYLEDGKKILEINILPEKYCNFDCIFCSIGKSYNKVDTQQSFDKMDNSLRELENMIENYSPDLVYINSKGESLINSNVNPIIDLIKNKGVSVRLLSNGYLLGEDKYMRIANKCDEVIGQIKAISEEDFQKIQKPIEGYTLKAHLASMTLFNKQYRGRFILEIMIIKGYNDTEESINKLRDIINKLSPDKIVIEKINDKRFKKKLGISNERYEYISEILLAH
ncbi:radical SAM protein [Dethiothermospora halolimnae]|uniref:radical SAM protein n=1 Tax=Dethiothermospora halolimnae TaxID=3114390 RepID=UPI003CCB8D23